MAGKEKTNEAIKLNSYDELFGEKTKGSDTTELEIRELHDFHDHPFHVTDDEDMEELVQSIREKGVLVPLTVRPLSTGGYEVISGHRRKHAAGLAGLFKVPAIIRELSEEDAVDIMIYSNIQRTNILPSEKAFAYRLQLETMSHRGKKGSSSPEEVGKKYGDNARKVQRYIRLTYLKKELLDLVDTNKLTSQAGYALSFLPEREQTWVVKIYQTYQKLPNGKTAEDIRNRFTDKVLTKDMLETLILGKSLINRKVVLNQKRINDIFSTDYEPEQIEEIIYQLLDRWKTEKSQQTA